MLRYCFSFTFLLAILWLSATTANSDTPQIQFEHLTREEGLSQGRGKVIYQDHQQFMWIGTQQGLNKYNGYDITVYRPDADDTTSISSGNITVIYEDQYNKLWIGTEAHGLNRYKRDSDSFKVYQTNSDKPEQGLTGNDVADIVEDRHGNLWIAAQPGLNKFDRDSEKFRHFKAEDTGSDGLSHSSTTALCEDSRGNLWVGTEGGLNRWNEETEEFIHFTHDPEDPHSISENLITEIYEDNRGTLWVGTANGLNRWHPEEGTFTRYQYDPDDPSGISGNSILSIFEDSRDTLWIGVTNAELNMLDRENEQFHHVKPDPDNPKSLMHDSVWSIYESNERMLWVGTYYGGVSMLNLKDPNFEHYRQERHLEQTLSNNFVTSFLEDRHGNFYVGTDGGGLNIFDRPAGTFAPALYDPNDPDNFLSSDVVLALEEDSDGNVWIGYFNGGVTRYDPVTGQAQHYLYDSDDPHSISSEHIFTMHNDRDGQMWFGTLGNGLNRYDAENDRFIRIGLQGEGTGFASDIYEDSRGNLWVGTYGGGLRAIDPETYEVKMHFYAGDAGLSSNEVSVIHEDRNNDLWIGTQEGNLHRFDYETNTFDSFSTDDGLPSDVISGILDDEQGRIWISTYEGISRFDPDSETFTNFEVQNGLQGREFLPRSYYEDREGYMYFGGINGFNRFHPEEVEIDDEVRPVVLTDFKIFNESVTSGQNSPLDRHISQAEHIVLPHDALVLTFDYVALNYEFKKGYTYAYKMEGFNEDWQYVEATRSATYTNLDPGHYTFKVRAANSYGVWGEETASVEVEVMPPFWQTAWFYLLSVLLGAGVVWVIYRMRVRAITRRNKQLEEEVNKRTSELYHRNEELRQALHDLSETRSRLIEKAHKAGMADLASGVLHNVGNILNSVNTSVGVMEEVLNNTNVASYKRANQLLRENIDNIESFITEDRRGRQLLQYYLKLEEPMDREVEELHAQTRRLAEKVKLIADVISAQQNFASAGRVTEQLPLDKLVDDTLMVYTGSIDRHGIEIIRDYGEVEPLDLERSKVAHVLINLFKNAKEAMDHLAPEEKQLRISTRQDEEYIYLEVSDSGKGIPPEDVNEVFKHGFTTKQDGHGFGLHSSSNYMNEMGGSIKVESNSTGQGATFTLVFPRRRVSSGNGKAAMQTHNNENSHSTDNAEIGQKDSFAKPSIEESIDR